MAKKTSKKKPVAKAKKPAVKKKTSTRSTAKRTAAKTTKPKATKKVKKKPAAKSTRVKARAVKPAPKKKPVTRGFALATASPPYPAQRAVHCRTVVYAVVRKYTSLPFDDQSVLGKLMDPALMPNLAADINAGVPLPKGYRFRYTDIKPTWTVGQLVLETIARDKAAWDAGEK
jgi:hypothetical protein